MTITKAQHQLLISYQKQAQKLHKEIDKLITKAEKITKDKHGDWTFDAICNESPLEDVYQALDIIVK